MSRKHESSSASRSAVKWKIIAIVSILLVLGIVSFLLYYFGYFDTMFVFLQKSFYFFSFGSEGFWLLIAFLVVILLLVVFKFTGPMINRKMRTADYEKELSLTSNIYIMEAIANREQLEHMIRKRLRLRYLFSKSSDPSVLLCHHVGRKLVSGRGDEFTANLFFDEQNANLTVLIMEFTRWREKNGITRKPGIHAMQNFIQQVKDAVIEVDSMSTLNVVRR